MVWSIIYVGEQFTIGQKYFLAENSEILMLAISSILEADFVKGKKGMHWLGPG